MYIRFTDIKPGTEVVCSKGIMKNDGFFSAGHVFIVKELSQRTNTTRFILDGRNGILINVTLEEFVEKFSLHSGI